MIPKLPSPAAHLGLLGGTFDPVHIGHLRIALCAQHHLGLDQVHFLPTPQPPHKTNQQITAYQHRLKMIEHAIAPHNDLLTNGIESELPAPHFA